MTTFCIALYESYLSTVTSYRKRMAATVEIVAIWSMPKVVGCWSSVEGMGAVRLTTPFLLNILYSQTFLKLIFKIALG